MHSQYRSRFGYMLYYISSNNSPRTSKSFYKIQTSIHLMENLLSSIPFSISIHEDQEYLNYLSWFWNYLQNFINYITVLLRTNLNMVKFGSPFALTYQVSCNEKWIRGVKFKHHRDHNTYSSHLLISYDQKPAYNFYQVSKVVTLSD